MLLLSLVYRTHTLASDTFSSALLAAPAEVTVLGTSPSADGRMQLTRLNSETGELIATDAISELLAVVSSPLVRHPPQA
jgi:hypothetical protein